MYLFQKAVLLLFLCFAQSPGLLAEEHVVLLHGLARTEKSMNRMEQSLKDDGYVVSNVRYPSRSNTVEALSEATRPGIASNTASADKVHFVTHSMGGILLRQMQSDKPFPNLGRVVMLSPPSQGSEVVDKLGHLDTFRWLNGPAGDQLGTSSTNLLATLPKIDFELGILTGDRSINWILSMLIPGKDDGKVSIENAKCPGMKDFAVIHATHPCIMKNQKAIRLTKLFLKTGSFTKNDDSSAVRDPGIEDR